MQIKTNGNERIHASSMLHQIYILFEDVNELHLSYNNELVNQCRQKNITEADKPVGKRLQNSTITLVCK